MIAIEAWILWDFINNAFNSNCNGVPLGILPKETLGGYRRLKMLLTATAQGDGVKNFAWMLGLHYRGCVGNSKVRVQTVSFSECIIASIF